MFATAAGGVAYGHASRRMGRARDDGGAERRGPNTRDAGLQVSHTIYEAPPAAPEPRILSFFAASGASIEFNKDTTPSTIWLTEFVTPAEFRLTFAPEEARIVLTSGRIVGRTSSMTCCFFPGPFPPVASALT